MGTGSDLEDALPGAPRRPPAQFVRIAATCALVGLAMAAIAWYGVATHTAATPPEPFLSSPLVATLNHKDWPAFVGTIERLPSIDAPDRDGMTVLMAVVVCGDDEELAYVLARGAHVNHCHHARGTPLIAALVRGDAAAARMLLQRGADAACVTSSGDTPLLAAVRGGSVECVKLVLANAAGNPMPAGIRDNPLNSFALADGEEDTVRMLLAGGVDPNRAGRNGELPLVTAVLSGAEGRVSLLLTAGADPDRADARGRTARSAAATSPRIAAMLRGAEPQDGPQPRS